MTDKEVVEMLKEMQEETAHTMGFFVGHVTQAWVIRDLLGAKIAELESRSKFAKLSFKEPKQGIKSPVCREWPPGTDEAGRRGGLWIEK